MSRPETSRTMENAMYRLPWGIILLPTLALAQVPAKLSYQGRLLSNDGRPLSGPVSVSFSIFASAQGGTALWSETQTLGLADGYYAAQLGDVTNLPAGTFDGSERFLSLTIDGSELLPRQKVNSVPYAVVAGSSDDADGNLFPDPYFEHGMTFWTLNAGSAGTVVASSAPIGGTRVFANSPTQVAWISSSRMVPINHHHTYEVKGSFRRTTDTGSAGGIYLAVLLFDENRALIGGDGSWWYFPVANLQLTDTTWHTYSAVFGSSSGKSFPPAARYMKVGAILNYDGAVPGNRTFEVAGLGIQDLPTPSTVLSNDGAVTIAGTGAPVSQLLSEPQTLPRGTYLVTFYNCLSETSAPYYIQATAVATSGTIVSGFFNKHFGQLTAYSQAPFVLKVKSETATVRFKVYNPTGATVTQAPSSCTSFYWSQIGL